MIAELLQAFEDFQQERSVRSIILTGAGDSFCSGTDLAELKETSDQPDALMRWHEDTRQFQELIEYMLRFPKPIIASINGWAVGNGVALLLACDTAVSGETAKLLLPESRRGLVPGITAPLLSFRLGSGQTARLLLSGHEIEASAALKLGLIHEVVDDDIVWVRCQSLSENFAKGSIQSHQMIKRIINETIGEQLLDQLRVGAADTATARTTESAKEGIQAFLEKRIPDFERQEPTD